MFSCENPPRNKPLPQWTAWRTWHLRHLTLTQLQPEPRPVLLQSLACRNAVLHHGISPWMLHHAEIPSSDAGFPLRSHLSPYFCHLHVGRPRSLEMAWKCWNNISLLPMDIALEMVFSMTKWSNLHGWLWSFTDLEVGNMVQTSYFRTSATYCGPLERKGTQKSSTEDEYVHHLSWF